MGKIIDINSLCDYDRLTSERVLNSGVMPPEKVMISVLMKAIVEESQTSEGLWKEIYQAPNVSELLGDTDLVDAIHDKVSELLEGNVQLTKMLARLKGIDC